MPLREAKRSAAEKDAEFDEAANFAVDVVSALSIGSSLGVFGLDYNDQHCDPITHEGHPRSPRRQSRPGDVQVASN